MRHTQLGESPAGAPGDFRVLQRAGEHFDDVVVAPEVSEMFERQVDRPGHRARAAQVAKLVGLSLAEGHVATIHPRADAPLHSD